MNNRLNQIQDLLNNPLFGESEKYDLLKDIILEQNFAEIQNVDLSEKVEDLFEQYLENYNNQDPFNETVIKTGFENLDNNLYGLNLGEVVVIAARPGMGKTQFMVNLVTNIAQLHKVQFFTFDLSKAALLNRFVACLTGISTKYLLHKRLSNTEYDKLVASKSKIQYLNLFLNDEVQQSLTSFINLCVDAIKNKGIKIIVIDYLQLVSTHRYKNNREQQVALIMRELKTLARAYNVCIIVSSQLSRSVETRGGDKRPLLSDLRESGSIEQDADKVMFLYRPDYYKITEDEDGNSVVNMMEVIVAKNNTDKTFSTYLWINENFTIISDIQSNKVVFNFPTDRLNELNFDI